jgi:site-specific recombinase XerD
VQDKFPARWLTYEQAFGSLLGVCQAEGQGDLGLRDEVVMRLGLGGMRVDEIMHLRVGNLHLTDEPKQIRWIGKKGRPRDMVVEARFLDLLRRYLDRYASALGRPLNDDDPLVCRQKPGSGKGRVSWGNPLS